jgi:hypothetical protein
VWRRIKGLMAKLLCAYHVSGPKYSRENCGACFDLFGVDLLLDRFFQPVSVATRVATVRPVVNRTVFVSTVNIGRGACAVQMMALSL